MALCTEGVVEADAEPHSQTFSAAILTLYFTSLKKHVLCSSLVLFTISVLKTKVE